VGPKVAVVTGASSGIGKATAVALARRGYDVALAARRADRLEEAAEACRAVGRSALPVVADVTRQEQVEALVARTLDEWGRLDVMVNNAGRGLRALVHEMTDAQMRAIFDVNYFGVFYGAQAAAKVMMRQRSGHIFNVSSVIGKRGVPFNAAYCATKFAVVGLTEALRVEMKPYHVRVTCVCPALTRTEFFAAMENPAPSSGTAFARTRGLTSPRTVARRIARAVGKPVPELVFSPGGRFLVILSVLWPAAADRIMQVYHDRLMRDVPPPPGNGEGLAHDSPRPDCIE